LVVLHIAIFCAWRRWKGETSLFKGSLGCQLFKVETAFFWRVVLWWVLVVVVVSLFSFFSVCGVFFSPYLLLLDSVFQGRSLRLLSTWIAWTSLLLRPFRFLSLFLFLIFVFWDVLNPPHLGVSSCFNLFGTQ